MKKIIMKTLVARLVAVAIHRQRLLACKGHKLLMQKEIDRHERTPVAIRIYQKAGDPGA